MKIRREKWVLKRWFLNYLLGMLVQLINRFLIYSISLELKMMYNSTVHRNTMYNCTAHRNTKWCTTALHTATQMMYNCTPQHDVQLHAATLMYNCTAHRNTKWCTTALHTGTRCTAAHRNTMYNCTPSTTQNDVQLFCTPQHKLYNCTAHRNTKWCTTALHTATQNDVQLHCTPQHKMMCIIALHTTTMTRSKSHHIQHTPKHRPKGSYITPQGKCHG